MKHPMWQSFPKHAATRLLVAALYAASVPLAAQDITVARYSTLRTTPTIAQQDPLAGMVSTTFPDSITRVGQAIAALLVPSGYRLAAASEVAREALLALPLPDAQRVLGPTPLRVALQTLAGSAFVVVEDPVHRLVSFERCLPDAKKR